MSISTPTISEYRIERELGAGSILARESNGRRVVLKMLEADCLLKGQLHPMIKDRLGRVREIAHLGVANLHGAQREGEKAFLVWEFVEGKTLEEFLRGVELDKKKRAELAMEVVLAVEGLHSLGIVHGGIHLRNVIVNQRSEVKLTHVSPLLYHEESVDISALQVLIREMGVEIAHQQTVSAIAGELMRIVRPGVGAEMEGKGVGGGEGVRLRRVALIGAVVAAVIGVVVAWIIWKKAVGQAEPATAWKASSRAQSGLTRPHPNPLPEGEGTRGAEPAMAWKVSSRAQSDLTRPHPNPLPEGEGTGGREAAMAWKASSRAQSGLTRPHPNPLPEGEGTGGALRDGGWL
jgi:Protein tyrosine and serine/threonine kinase